MTEYICGNEPPGHRQLERFFLVESRRNTSGKKGVKLEKLSMKGCEIQFETVGLGENEYWIQYLELSPDRLIDIDNLVQRLLTITDEELIEHFDFGEFFLRSKNAPESSTPQKLENYVAVFVTTPLSRLTEVRSRLMEPGK